MGSTCGCTSFLKVETPRPLPPTSRTSLSTPLSSPKFQDIVPAEDPHFDPTERHLNSLNDQLSTFLLQFQHVNGAISQRFTHRNFTEESPNLAKIDFSTSIHQRKPQLAPLPLMENELYLPLANENIEIQIEEPSFSSIQPSQKRSESATSCIISQRTHILSESIFTERITEKKQFYKGFNRMKEVLLQDWLQNYRLSYQLYIDELLELRQDSANAKLVVCLEAIDQYWRTHQIHLLSYSQQPYGIKIHANGIKRLFPITPASISQPSLELINKQLVDNLKQYSLADIIYCLTGWIPEQLSIGQIKNFNGIFDRLSTNMQDGNSLITFSRITSYSEEYCGLKQIDFEKQLLVLDTAGNKITIPDILLDHTSNLENNELVISFENFIELFDNINLSWNPSIYDVTISREGKINYREKSVIKYLLIIPPSSQDIEIRLFLERHHNYDQQEQFINFRINLYEYQGAGEDLEMNDPIRQIRTSQLIYSDVFIFESCKEKTQYMLAVTFDDSSIPETELFFTLTLYSFVELHFKELKTKALVKEVSLKANMTEQNTGFGINSPFFNKNLQVSIQTDAQKELTVTIKASRNLIYQICLIPDMFHRENLIKLSLQNIINNSLISTEKIGNGTFTINTAFNNYLMVINTYTPANEEIDVKFALFASQNRQEQSTLKVKQLRQSLKVIFVQEIKWMPHHSGPRKRLKSNSIDVYQPLQTFTQFFKNPMIDKQMFKGKYQFFVKSETFREYFNSIETYEEKNQCEPPALSMAIFQVSANKKEFKIILDDAFYVPFGVGFWSSQIELQEGNYRFVFPKIDKDFSKGSFGIVEC